jgi:CelD/BcsL family acetyltransferase involved in cellulose biosynthesis
MTAGGPPAAIATVAGEWDDLAVRLGAPPFLRPGWFGAWWDAFGRGHMGVVQVRDHGRLAGVMPVARRFGSIHSPTNWHTSLFGPVVGPDVAGDLAARLFEGRPRHVSLSFLDPRDPGTVAVRTAAKAAGYRELTRVRMRSPFISTAPGWDAYWAGRPKKLRNSIRKRLDTVGRMGSVSFDVVDGSGPWERALAEGLQVESSGWKGGRGTAVESRPDTRRFYSGMARWAAEQGLLRLGFLRLDGRAMAFQLWLEDGEAHYSLKRAYDPAFASVGPGMLLQHEIVARAFRVGLRTFEFLGEAEDWKLRWTDTTHDRLLVQAFAPTVGGRLTAAAFVHVRPLAKRGRDAIRRVRRDRSAATEASPAENGRRSAGGPGRPPEDVD